MRRGAITAGLALAAALGWARAALAAAPEPPPEVTDAVPGHPGVTYLDLLRQVIPDLAYSAADKQLEGHLRALRHIAGKAEAKDPPDPVVASYVELRRIKAGGRPRLALVADLGQAEDSTASTTLLALFDDAPKPKLLDAVDVGVDKDTSLNDDPSVMPLGPGDDALVTYSEHFNSNQGYRQWLVIFVRSDRLRLLDDVALLADSYCGFKRDETPAFKTAPGSPYATLVVTVTEKLTRLDEDCGDQKVPAPYVRTYRNVYRWDPARRDFVAHGDLDKLDKLNQGRL